MALSDNIKKFQEEKKISHQATTCRQVICFKADSLPLGKMVRRCPDLIMAKKLALELDVSMDELISDEDVNDIQVNYGIWKSERIQNRIHLQELRKKLLGVMEILGSVFMALILLFRIQLERDIPVWLTISFFCVAIPLIVMNLLISKKLREM